MAGPNQPGCQAARDVDMGPGTRRESLDAKPRRVALMLIYTAGRSSSVPQGGRAGQAVWLWSRAEGGTSDWAADDSEWMVGQRRRIGPRRLNK